MKQLRGPCVTLALVAFAIPSTAAEPIKLLGAGATFPNPLYQRWIVEFEKLHPDIKIDYESIGSGGGVKSFTEGQIDFAAIDPALTPEQVKALGGAGKLVEVPTCAGAITVVYNLPVKAPINFTSEVLADIFLGKITRWNHPDLVRLNPKTLLPDVPITPVFRTSPSGDTLIFSTYLSLHSEQFREKVGSDVNVRFPTGIAFKGGDSTGNIVVQTEGSIGYLDLPFAEHDKLSYGQVRNDAGHFVKPSPQATTAAEASALTEVKGTLLAGPMLRPADPDAYPIAAFTYVVVFKDLHNLKTLEHATALVAFLRWATHEGQRLTPDFEYAPLHERVQRRVDEAVGSLTYKEIALHD